MSKHVLIIDDERDIRETLQELLESEGHHITLASNGQDALNLLHSPSEEKFDLILLDLMMPVMSGIDFRLEQQKDPQLRQIPTYLMSASRNTQKVSSELELSGFINKPIEINELFSVIENAV